MKFIIYVAGNIRNGQRVGLPDFPYSEIHGKFVYQCRELTFEEFNAAALIVFNPFYHTNEFTFCPQAIAAKSEAAAAPSVVKREPALLPPEKFRFHGKGIFMGEKRVAGLFGEERNLRVFDDELRVEIEKWLINQPPIVL